jgi:hypothetical protein
MRRQRGKSERLDTVASVNTANSKGSGALNPTNFNMVENYCDQFVTVEVAGQEFGNKTMTMFIAKNSFFLLENVPEMKYVLTIFDNETLFRYPFSGKLPKVNGQGNCVSLQGVGLNWVLKIP